MSVVGVAREAPDSPFNFNFDLHNLSCDRKFLVQVDSYGDGAIQVCNAVGIPKPLEIYQTATESNPYIRCRGLTSCERVSPNALVWAATFHYSTPEPKDHREKSGSKRDHPSEAGNPLQEFPDVQMSEETVSVPVTRIYDPASGKFIPPKVANGQIIGAGSSGNPIMKDETRYLLKITRNEDLSTPISAIEMAYADAVNSDPFFGVLAGQARMKSIIWDTQYKQVPQLGGLTVGYYRIVYTIAFKNDWDYFQLNCGDWHWDSLAQTHKEPFLDRSGNPIVGLLDENGLKLAEDKDPQYLRFRIYARVPFAPLNLPVSPSQFQ